MAYKRWISFEGELRTVKEINAAYMAATGDSNPWADEDSPDWKAWVEYENGRTYLLADGDVEECEDEESRYVENDERAVENAFVDWLFNERRGDALKLYAQYARRETK